MEKEVSLEALNMDNWLKICNLSVSDAQKAIFTVPNVYWIGISRYEEKSTLFAVKANTDYVGLIGERYDRKTNTGHINPLMIDQHHQKNGYGRQALCLMIAYLREKYSPVCIEIANRKANTVAGRLYESLGFHVYGEDGPEQLRRLEIMAGK